MAHVLSHCFARPRSKRQPAALAAHRSDDGMQRIRLKTLAYLTAIWCCSLIALAVLTVVALAVSPVLWLILTRNWPDQFTFIFFRWDLFLGITTACFATTTGSIAPLKAILRKRPPNRPLWVDELPTHRHQAIADLIDFLRICGVELPPGEVGVYLAFPTGVQWVKTGPPGARHGALLLGLHAIAALSAAEIRALAVKHAFQVLDPPSPVHPTLTSLAMSVRHWRSAVPPDEGFPSLVHKLLEWLEAILKPIAPQSERWSHTRALERVPAETLLAAQQKIQLSSVALTHYMTLYLDALNSGGLPPFTDGLYQLVSKRMNHFFAGAEPFYLQLDGLWVHEQRFVRALPLRRNQAELSMTTWNDLLLRLGDRSWNECASQLRPLLAGRSVRDLPELVRGWRSLTRRFIGERVSNVTPDVLRQLMITSLGSVFAVVLLEAGWKNATRFGEESTFRKDEHELKPFELLREVGAGRMRPEDFALKCGAAAGLNLS